MEENFRFTIVCEADVATPHPSIDRCAAHPSGSGDIPSSHVVEQKSHF